MRKALLIKHDGLSVDYVIQSLQQPKRPKYFECRMDTARIPYGDDGWKTIETGIKTITNSQNQTELVGTYEN